MTTATLPAPAPKSLTLAKTGTVSGRPAMIGFGDKKTVLLVMNEAGDTWVQEKEVAFSGIRGMGLLTKDLDAGSARRADEKPVFAIEAVEAAAPQAEAPAPAAIEPVIEAAPATPEKAKRPKKAAAPKAEKAPAVPVEPASPVIDPALVNLLGHDRALAITTTTDLAFLRNFRETAIKTGLPAEVVRAITLRAGEVACGFNLAALRKAASTKPAAQASKPAKVAPSTAEKKMGIRELLAAGAVKAGDEVHLRGKPDTKTTLTADGNAKGGQSLGAWAKSATGWSSVNVYVNLVHSRSGKLLRDLRTA
jgi:hypothetical protein